MLLLPTARGQEEIAPSATPQDEIVHVLNRITFGPHPGDVERVEQMGLQNFIQQQLHPESIDDSAVDQKLQSFVTLNLTNEELLTLYQEEKKKSILKQKEVGKSPEEVQALMAEEKKFDSTGTLDMETVRERLQKVKQSPTGELSEAKLIRAVDSQRQLQEVLVDFWTNHFNIDMHKGLCKVLKITDDRDVIRPNVFGHFRDLLEASAKSPAMLHYLDNALNSKPTPGSSSDQATPVATATEAMQMTAQEEAPAPKKKKSKRAGGINENYAREIMELHTLGVDGGYTQQDVQEVARCFTGWTIDHYGGFKFDESRHDDGSKVVLGHRIPAHGGIRDGEKVLDILSSSPATAHHIAYELCQRFVSDTPPDSVVDRTARVFQDTDGDLRKVVASILASPEFLSPSSFGAKIKSPLEYTVSAVRATASILVPPDNSPEGRKRPQLEGEIMNGKGSHQHLGKNESLNYHIYALGEPLFNCIPPTGYGETSGKWVSPGALIERLNFAMALAAQQVTDVRFDPKNVIGNADLDHPEEVLEHCVSALLPGGISNSTRNVLMSAAVPATGDSKTINPSKLIALILGSPEFQRK
jgi:uncharacterized protein (DUF1800 family)